MKITRLGKICVLSVVLVTGSLLFVVSQNVQSTERDIRFLEQQIAKEEETVRVLKAEWSYLNRPDRLERLANDENIKPSSLPKAMTEEITLEKIIVPVPVKKPSVNGVVKPQIIQVSTQESSVPAPVQKELSKTDEAASFNDLIKNLDGGVE